MPYIHMLLCMYRALFLAPTASSLSYQLSRLKFGNILSHISQRFTTAESMYTGLGDEQARDVRSESPAPYSTLDANDTAYRQPERHDKQSTIRGSTADVNDQMCKYKYRAVAKPVHESKKDM
jgi:hypothetical protein